jgi:hypothetical protein
MYSVNGIPLDNAGFGWVFRALSRPLSEITRELLSMRRVGRDGVVAGLPASTSPVTLKLVVKTPRLHLESLVALVGSGGVLTLTGPSPRAAVFEYLSHSLEGYGPAERIVDATFLIRIPGAFWRDRDQSTTPADLSAASVSLTCFPGLSAPVQDAAVRVKGAATGIRITDASGAWLALPPVAAAQYVRFEADSGRAFVTSTDTWTGGTEVSGDVDFGGPRSVFEITPVLSPSDPSARSGSLTIATTTRTGAVAAVRGRAAYVL